MDLHLNDKVVLVTGGAKGIGEAICISLFEEGAIPVIVDKDDGAGRVLSASMERRALFIHKDIQSSEACRECIDEVVSRFGKIDGLVNNAGRNDGVGLETGSPEKFIQSMTANSGHYFFMAHAALPHLKKTMGSMVNISSKTALTGQGNTSGYVAAKGAILALTREWAAELLPHGIRVNAVVPAEVWTPLYEDWISRQSNPQEKLKFITDKIPLGKRMTTAKEIADTVVFLLSDRASHITGQWIHVDGGYVHLDRALS